MPTGTGAFAGACRADGAPNAYAHAYSGADGAPCPRLICDMTFEVLETSKVSHSIAAPGYQDHTIALVLEWPEIPVAVHLLQIETRLIQKQLGLEAP